MKAKIWAGRNSVEVQSVPDPKILNDRDAIVRVTSTAICGSDLHLYDGYIPTVKHGDVLGHEFMGEESKWVRRWTICPSVIGWWCRFLSHAGRARPVIATCIRYVELQSQRGYR